MKFKKINLTKSEKQNDNKISMYQNKKIVLKDITNLPLSNIFSPYNKNIKNKSLKKRDEYIKTIESAEKSRELSFSNFFCDIDHVDKYEFKYIMNYLSKPLDKNSYSLYSSIIKLDLNKIKLTTPQIKNLSTMLSTNNYLLILSIKNTGLNPTKFKILNEGLKKNSGIEKLDISHNKLKEESLGEIVSLLKANSNIGNLYIQNCDFGKDGIDELVNYLSGDPLLKFTDGALAMPDTTKFNKNLKFLAIDENELDSLSAYKLLTMIMNKSIKIDCEKALNHFIHLQQYLDLEKILKGTKSLSQEKLYTLKERFKDIRESLKTKFKNLEFLEDEYGNITATLYANKKHKNASPQLTIHYFIEGLSEDEEEKQKKLSNQKIDDFFFEKEEDNSSLSDQSSSNYNHSNLLGEEDGFGLSFSQGTNTSLVDLFQ